MKTVVYEDQIEMQNLPGRDLRWLFTPEMKVTDNFTMNVVIIKPSNTVKPAHAHPDLEEVIYITSGEGQVLIDGKVHELRTGTAVLFKAGSIHMVTGSLSGVIYNGLWVKMTGTGNTGWEKVSTS